MHRGRSLLSHQHSEDKSDHALLAWRLAVATGCSVAVPNYRLSTQATPLQHPAHAEDVLAALSFLLSWHGPLPAGASVPRLPYDRTQLYLVGHSCGAHIIASIVLDSSKVTPTLTPPSTSAAMSHVPNLISSIRAVVFTEGIYDLDLILSSFPAYKDWFIAPAFGQRGTYAPFSVTQHPFREHRGMTGYEGTHIRWLIIHSNGDTLVDLKQAEAMYDHLRSLHPASVGGLSVPENSEAADEGSLGAKVTRNWVDIDVDHDDVLLGEPCVKLISEFISDGSG